MHASLQPKTNIHFLVSWTVVAVVVAVVGSPTPWLLMGGGGVRGLCAGVMQLRSLRESSASFLAAQTVMDVRSVLTSSRAGRLYLHSFWGSMAVLFALTFVLHRGCAFVGLLAGYSAFAFTREWVTLLGTFELHSLSTKRRE